ncbi:MAG: hypothetical protein WKG07_12960 [Hymenobacter sp.]
MPLRSTVSPSKTTTAASLPPARPGRRTPSEVGNHVGPGRHRRRTPCRRGRRRAVTRPLIACSRLADTSRTRAGPDTVTTASAGDQQASRPARPLTSAGPSVGP